jgi:hypothetical protein
MPNQNQETLFYVVRSPFNQDHYSIHSLLTDRILMDKATMEVVKEFLIMNNPSHPMLQTSGQATLSNMNREEYLKTYTLYYNSYQNPYAMSQGPYNYAVSEDKAPSDFGTFSYVVADNDVCSGTTVTNTQDDCDSDSYGDSNHLPYITGRIGHTGD